MKRQKMYLNRLDFEKTVKDFADRGGTQIDFNTTIGDPLLDKSLLDRARYVGKFPQFTSLGFVTTL
jgi:hypothetical protein